MGHKRSVAVRLRIAQAEDIRGPFTTRRERKIQNVGLAFLCETNQPSRTHLIISGTAQ